VVIPKKVNNISNGNLFSPIFKYDIRLRFYRIQSEVLIVFKKIKYCRRSCKQEWIWDTEGQWKQTIITVSNVITLFVATVTGSLWKPGS
jgi:hypothetical protein